VVPSVAARTTAAAMIIPSRAWLLTLPPPPLPPLVPSAAAAAEADVVPAQHRIARLTRQSVDRSRGHCNCTALHSKNGAVTQAAVSGSMSPRWNSLNWQGQ